MASNSLEARTNHLSLGVPDEPPTEEYEPPSPYNADSGVQEDIKEDKPAKPVSGTEQWQKDIFKNFPTSTETDFQQILLQGMFDEFLSSDKRKHTVIFACFKVLVPQFDNTSSERLLYYDYYVNTCVDKHMMHAEDYLVQSIPFAGKIINQKLTEEELLEVQIEVLIFIKNSTCTQCATKYHELPSILSKLNLNFKVEIQYLKVYEKDTKKDMEAFNILNIPNVKMTDKFNWKEFYALYVQWMLTRGKCKGLVKPCCERCIQFWCADCIKTGHAQHECTECMIECRLVDTPREKMTCQECITAFHEAKRDNFCCNEHTKQKEDEVDLACKECKRLRDKNICPDPENKMHTPLQFWCTDCIKTGHERHECTKCMIECKVKEPGDKITCQKCKTAFKKAKEGHFCCNEHTQIKEGKGDASFHKTVQVCKECKRLREKNICPEHTLHAVKDDTYQKILSEHDITSEACKIELLRLASKHTHSTDKKKKILEEKKKIEEQINLRDTKMAEFVKCTI